MSESLERVRGMLSGYINPVTTSQHHIDYMERLISLEHSDISRIIRSLVSGTRNEEVTKTENAVLEYLVQERNWFLEGLTVFESVAHTILTSVDSINYEIHSTCRAGGHEMPVESLDFINDVLPEIDVFPEELIAQVKSPFCSEHESHSVPKRSYVSIAGNNGIFGMSYRAKKSDSRSGKISNIKYGAGLKEQRSRKRRINDFLGMSIQTQDELSNNPEENQELSDNIMDDVKALIQRSFPPRSLEQGRLYEDGILETDAKPHLVYLDNKRTVWKEKKIRGDSGWEGYKAEISLNGISLDLQLQKKSHYEAGQQDHKDYKVRQLATLPADVLLKRNAFKRSLDDLFAYVLLSRDVSVNMLSRNPLLAARYEIIKDTYS